MTWGSTSLSVGSVLLLGAAIVLMIATGCELVEPDSSPRLVAEGYLQPESPAATLRLSHTGGLNEPIPREAGAMAVDDAELELLVGGERILYQHSSDSPGSYEPVESGRILAAGEAFSVQARWNGQEAQAEGVIPPAVQLDSVRVSYTDEAVRAVFVDSLFLDPIVFDSLRLSNPPPGTPEHGWAYPVEVTFWWQAPADEAGTDHWVHLRLRPELQGGKALDDFFLRSEQIMPEDDTRCDANTSEPCSGASSREWTGVYGIPVAHEKAPMPAHSVNVSLIRSGEDYARFASTRRDPERREPVSNVSGGLGIVAGIALDSLTVSVD